MRKKTFPANRSYGPTDPNDRPPATSRRDVMSTRDTSALTKTGALRNTTGSHAVCRRNRIMSAFFDPMPVQNGARLRPLHRLWQHLRVHCGGSWTLVFFVAFVVPRFNSVRLLHHESPRSPRRPAVLDLRSRRLAPRSTTCSLACRRTAGTPSFPQTRTRIGSN